VTPAPRAAVARTQGGGGGGGGESKRPDFTPKQRSGGGGGSKKCRAGSSARKMPPPTVRSPLGERTNGCVSTSSSPAAAPPPAVPAFDRSALQEQWTCPICMDVFRKPSTTVCGHTFCKKCLAQSLRSCGPSCPSCRTRLRGLPRSGLALNVALWGAIQQLFPDAAAVTGHATPAKSVSGGSEIREVVVLGDSDDDEGSPLQLSQEHRTVAQARRATRSARGGGPIPGPAGQLPPSSPGQLRGFRSAAAMMRSPSYSQGAISSGSPYH